MLINNVFDFEIQRTLYSFERFKLQICYVCLKNIYYIFNQLFHINLKLSMLMVKNMKKNILNTLNLSCDAFLFYF